MSLHGRIDFGVRRVQSAPERVYILCGSDCPSCLQRQLRRVTRVAEVTLQPFSEAHRRADETAKGLIPSFARPSPFQERNVANIKCDLQGPPGYCLSCVGIIA